MNKCFCSFILILFFGSVAFGQVPNGGFESWTAGNPDNWLTNNVPGIFTTITQSNSSHSGSSAAKGEVVDYMGTILSPLLYSTNLQGLGFPISTRYNSVKCYLRYSPSGGDSIFVFGYLTQNSSLIGAGVYSTGALLNDYTEVNIPIEYLGAGTPDTAIIGVIIFGPDTGDPHLGSEFYIDDITMSEQVVGVSDNNNSPSEYNLMPNFPNPFNPSTTISYSIPERSGVVLKVYDVLGKEIAVLVNETKEAGSYAVKFDAAALPSGVYIYTIKAGNYTSTRKMMLTK